MGGKMLIFINKIACILVGKRQAGKIRPEDLEG